MTSNRKRVSRLSMRKGRSIVHKNLEDNYGAVITANHEAIAQILEQVPTNILTFDIFLDTIIVGCKCIVVLSKPFLYRNL